MPQLPRGFLVKGPKCTQAGFGLLSVVDPTTPSDPHWEASGVEWEDYLCNLGTQAFLDYCPPATGFTKEADADIQFCHADPFLVKGSYACSTGGRPVSEAFEIARQRLLSWEGYQVENVFWTGLAANGEVNPSLQSGNDECEIVTEDISGGAALDPASAVSLLEGTLGDVTSCPVLHIPAEFAGFMASADLLVKDGDKLYTHAGSLVIAGHGYPGTGPGNTEPAAGEAWLYGTGPVAVWRSNVFMTPGDVAEGVNRQINNITVHAERVYSVGFSCAVYAVRATLTACCS